MNRGSRWLNLCLATCLVLSMLALPGLIPAGLAQVGGWRTPRNISLSGAATDPALVADATGDVHVVWNDAYQGSMYVHRGTGEWSEAEAVDFPFIGFPVRFLATPSQRVLAFWLDEDSTLYTSQVSAQNFGRSISWTVPKAIAESALAFDLVADDADGVHLVYIRPLSTTEFPAGVYYRRSLNSGVVWQTSRLLQASPYYRSLPPEQAHVQVALSRLENGWAVYAGWDLPARKQLYFSRSTNQGATWSEPVIIDKPEVSTGFTQPFDIEIYATGENVLLSWQKGDPQGGCAQFYQISSNNGNSWGIAQRMIPDMLACARERSFVGSRDNLVWLQITLLGQVYLVAWNGQLWSEPVIQPALVSLEDSDTFRSVALDNRKYAYLPAEDRLVVVGNEAGETDETGETTETGDIWLMDRLMGESRTWFPAPPVWQEYEIVSTGQKPYEDPHLLIDSQERLHLLWLQEPLTPADFEQRELHYSRWDGSRWSRATTLFRQISPHIGKITTIIDTEDRLSIVWEDSQSGELYFSWASSERAPNYEEWTKPVAIPVPDLPAREPVLLGSANGEIYLAYSIPINERRGVYLTSSTDQGQSWTPPVTIFNAAIAGWEMVSQPQLAETEPGRLHALWVQDSLPGGPGPVAIYESISIDGGQSWTEAQLVAESNPAWSGLKGNLSGELIYFWQVTTGDRATTLTQVNDELAGRWRPAPPVNNPTTALGEPTIASRADTRMLHILQASLENSEQATLRHWQWTGELWQPEPSTTLQLGADREPTAPVNVGSAFSPNGLLGAVYAGAVNHPDQPAQYALYVTTRRIANVEIISPPLAETIPPAAVPPEMVNPSITSTPESAIATVSPTAPLARELLDDRQTPPRLGPLRLDREWSGAILGAAVAILIIALAGLGIQLNRQGKDFWRSLSSTIHDLRTIPVFGQKRYDIHKSRDNKTSLVEDQASNNAEGSVNDKSSKAMR